MSTDMYTIHQHSFFIYMERHLTFENIKRIL